MHRRLAKVHKYDLKEGKEAGVVKVDFLPENITWTKQRQMLAAGVKGARGDCPGGSGTPCIQAESRKSTPSKCNREPSSIRTAGAP